ncbi:hypothetical protein AB6A40_006106 [Gnathostoma spinigerum]|uniref:Uncharacterized protein n=1 Tax=Gnathostoma spinigerum TaxID=75299 RepID=A0ABD6ERS6_9BILA
MHTFTELNWSRVRSWRKIGERGNCDASGCGCELPTNEDPKAVTGNADRSVVNVLEDRGPGSAFFPAVVPYYRDFYRFAHRPDLELGQGSDDDSWYLRCWVTCCFVGNFLSSSIPYIEVRLFLKFFHLHLQLFGSLITELSFPCCPS